VDKYQRTAQDLLALLGGSGNVTTLGHCVTRLRLILVDRDAVDQDQLRAHPAVLGVRDVGTQFQVIIGPAVVARLAAALDELVTKPAEPA
jgi:PTS system sucrose-specific IIC component